jgi:hypothetical protein
VTSSTDERVRAYIYERFVALGSPPTAVETGEALGVDGPAAYRRLADAHVIVLKPDSTDIWMAAPLSARPTPFLVTTPLGTYFGNCIWDALGVGAMLGHDFRVDTDCADCGTPMRLEVRGGELGGDAEGVAHFAVPAAHWWDDIGFT